MNRSGFLKYLIAAVAQTLFGGGKHEEEGWESVVGSMQVGVDPGVPGADSTRYVLTLRVVHSAGEEEVYRFISGDIPDKMRVGLWYDQEGNYRPYAVEA